MSKYVNVKFSSSAYSKIYTYEVPDWIEKKPVVGSLVVIPSPSAPLGYSIVQVVSLKLRNDTPGICEPIVDVIDQSAYKAQITAMACKSQLERKLKARYKQLSEIAWLDYLKQNDSESVNLIREFEALNNA